MTQKNGLYITPNQFASFAELEKATHTEIATRKRSLNFFNLSNILLLNPDPVLQKEGRNVEIYRDLLVDDRVGGNWGNRKAATLSLEWEVDRGERGKGKSRQAKIIEEWLESLDMQRIESEILDARLYGYQPMELTWEKRDGMLLPTDVIGKPAEWFLYNQDNELRFRSRDNPLYGEELPPRSFVVPRSNASYYFPYGLGMGASLFWPVAFKKGGWSFWITFAEKYGQAFAVGKIRRGATPAEMDDLADKLEQMVQDAIAVIYDDGSVEIMSDAGKSASSDLFQSIITEANAAISTVIMGHAGGGQSTPGRLGNDDLAKDVRGDLRDGDKKLVCQTMNQVIRWIGELNWGTTDVPTFGLWEEEEVDKDQADRDDKLTGPLVASGLKLSRSYYVRTYNLEESDLETSTPSTGSTKSTKSKEPEESEEPVELREHTCPHCSPSFAEADDTPDPAADIAAQALEAADGSALVDALYKHLQAAGSLKGVSGTLALVDPNYELLAPSAEALTQACVLANLTGRADVLEEISGSGAAFAEPLPFDEAIAFFRQKLSITSQTWTDLWQGEHSRQFTVAGAMRDDMLDDFRTAIESAIAEGTTYQTFLQEFDKIVSRYGWSYKGNRGWRSRVIYDTNVNTAYNAGRWAQLTDPDLLKVNPYLEYRHGDSVKPRQLHLSWNGITLPADDPWWKTHYTPNGWGCKCRVHSAGKRDLERAGKTGPDQAPNDGTYEWVDKKSGEIHEIPRGIDPGWAYNPGQQWLNPQTGKLEKL